MPNRLRFSKTGAVSLAFALVAAPGRWSLSIFRENYSENFYFSVTLPKILSYVNLYCFLQK